MLEGVEMVYLGLLEGRPIHSTCECHLSRQQERIPLYWLATIGDPPQQSVVCEHPGVLETMVSAISISVRVLEGPIAR